jgi:hypothetical protein
MASIFAAKKKFWVMSSDRGGRMPQSNSSKIVQLAEGADVVCPTCGVLVVNHAGRKPRPSREHVRFIYCNGECFEYIAPALQNKLEKAEALAGENDDNFDTWEWLEQNSPEGTTILEQTIGPIRDFAVWFGFRTAESTSSEPKRKTSNSIAKSSKGSSGKRGTGRHPPAKGN